MLIPTIGLHGQNYVGMDRDEVVAKMRIHHSSFTLAKEVNDDFRHFIKYENVREEQTIIFVFIEGECITISRMYNTWEFNRVNSMLNKKYKSTDRYRWEDKRDGKTYDINLRRGEWFLTVVIKERE